MRLRMAILPLLATAMLEQKELIGKRKRPAFAMGPELKITV